MTQVKVKGGKPSRGIADALESHVADMFSRPDGTWIAVVELSHHKRTEERVTSDDADYTERTVEVRLSALEVAGSVEDQEAAQALLDGIRERREMAGTLFDPAASSPGDGPPW